ncbi:MAG: hypothetical protein P4L83_02780, partial [Nevskia sp.]|nr:hypothetical protein [Nevskia sp.]
MGHTAALRATLILRSSGMTKPANVSSFGADVWRRAPDQAFGALIAPTTPQCSIFDVVPANFRISPLTLRLPRRMRRAHLKSALKRQFGPRNEHVDIDQIALFASDGSQVIEIPPADEAEDQP